MKVWSLLCQNKFFVHDSFTFVWDIPGVENRNNVEASLDIVSFVICIHGDETYNIVTCEAFCNSKMFCGYFGKLFKRVFGNRGKGKTFIYFNDKSYKPIDETPKADCVSPALAEMFM